MQNKIPENVASYRNRVIKNIKPFLSGETLLDVGCGDGEDAVLLLKYFKIIEAVDIEENPNWKKIGSGRLVLKTADAENLNYPDNSFDTVIEKDMLHHASDPVKALKEMVRIAKDRVIVLEANRKNPVFYLHLTLLGNHQHFTYKKLDSIIKASGAPYEIRKFSARVSPLNNSFCIKLTNTISDMCEKLKLYSPIIEYHAGIISKK